MILFFIFLWFVIGALSGYSIASQHIDNYRIAPREALGEVINLILLGSFGGFCTLFWAGVVNSLGYLFVGMLPTREELVKDEWSKKNV